MIGLELAPSWAYRDMLGWAWTGLLDGPSMLEECVGQMDRAALTPRRRFRRAGFHSRVVGNVIPVRRVRRA
jgi:hypothetical protein